MKYSILKIIASLTGVGAGIIVSAFSFFLLLFALAFSASGSDVRFASLEILAFALMLIGGITGGIAGGLVFRRPGVSTVAFIAASVLILIAAVPLLELSFWLIAPVVIFGTGALISRIISQETLRSYEE